MIHGHMRVYAQNGILSCAPTPNLMSDARPTPQSCNSGHAAPGPVTRKPPPPRIVFGRGRSLRRPVIMVSYHKIILLPV